MSCEFSNFLCRDLVVNVTDLHPANLSTLTGIHMSHWWQQEGHLGKTVCSQKKSPTLVGTSDPLTKGVNDVEYRCLCFLNYNRLTQ